MTRSRASNRSTELSEADFQTRVINLAERCGWRVVHIPTVPVRRGNRIIHMTAYKGHPGLPDLILARGGVVLLVELKSKSGSATPDQRAWLDAAGSNGRLWKPKDWAEAVAVLSGVRPDDQGETA